MVWTFYFFIIIDSIFFSLLLFIQILNEPPRYILIVGYSPLLKFGFSKDKKKKPNKMKQVTIYFICSISPFHTKFWCCSFFNIINMLLFEQCLTRQLEYSIQNYAILERNVVNVPCAQRDSILLLTTIYRRLRSRITTVFIFI